jgi:thiosulfate dehydrogenase [quinone] large subunit
LVGIALILGAFTTIALLAGIFMNFNYLLAGTVSANPVYLIEQLLLLFAGSAAFYWGLDRWLLPMIKERRSERNRISNRNNSIIVNLTR